MANANVGEVLFQRGQDESDDTDIWDDTALIKAYDEAVAVVKLKVAQQNGEVLSEQDLPTNKQKRPKKKKQKNKNNKKRKWKVGDHCRATFSEDGLQYEAEILSIDPEAGTCFVRYLGYGNEEEHEIKDIQKIGAKTKTREKESDAETDSDWQGVGVQCSSARKASSASSLPQGPGQWPGLPPEWTMPPPPMPPPHYPFPGFPPYPGFGMPSGQGSSHRLPTFPPPPPPLSEDLSESENEALCSMLMSWYMSGYHTGYYLGLKQGRQSTGGTSPYSSFPKR